MNEVRVIVYENSDSFLNYLIYNKIYYKSLCICSNGYELIISYDNYKKVRRRYKCSIIKYYGKVGIKYFLLHQKFMLISFFISLLLLYLLSNTIFEVNVNTNNIEIKNKIIEELNKNNLAKYKRKKSFDEILRIKESILKKNEDSLEWIEISNKGCIYIVDVTLRVKNKDTKSSLDESSIYASQDGVIKHIVVSSGTKMVEINDYVHKGDVLISGNIIKDEIVIDNKSAVGEVYAEVWYLASVSVPFKFTEYEKTGKHVNRYYLDIFNTEFTITGHYNSKDIVSSKKLLLDKPYLFFKLYKETKEIYEYKKYEIKEEEAYQLALSKSEDEIKKKLNKGEYIISKKVLKKRSNSSKMYIEVFFKVYKNIAYTSNIDIIGEKDGTST